MKNTQFCGLALFACLPLSGVAAPAAADPAAPFKHYQAWRDAPIADWRAANDRVGEVGGWRTYLREAQPGGGAGHDHAAAPARPQQPADPGQGGHHHHGH